MLQQRLSLLGKSPYVGVDDTVSPFAAETKVIEFFKNMDVIDISFKRTRYTASSKCFISSAIDRLGEDDTSTQGQH